MQHKYKIVLALAVVGVMSLGFLMVSGTPVVGQEEAASDWTVRCSKPEGAENAEEHCEIFQRLIVQETGQRVVEFAIGFPEDKKTARGVIIMPLGILLSDGAQMKIDDAQAFKFNIRYCTQDGCFAFLDMNEKILGMFRKGKAAEITFKALNGEPMAVKISLNGFAKALDKAGQS